MYFSWIFLDHDPGSTHRISNDAGFPGSLNPCIRFGYSDPGAPS
jgi:hypothetical protein